MTNVGGSQWTSEELWRELEEFRRQLQAAGLRPSSIQTYVGRATTFLRWLDGDYRPNGRQA
jgi:hypothetical protein